MAFPIDLYLHWTLVTLVPVVWDCQQPCWRTCRRRQVFFMVCHVQQFGLTVHNLKEIRYSLMKRLAHGSSHIAWKPSQECSLLGELFTGHFPVSRKKNPMRIREVVLS